MMRQLSHKLTTAALFISVIAITGCAGIQSPSGGPPDKDPPVVIKTNPAPGTLRFSGDRFSFSFNKYINRRSLEESFFVSPPIGDHEFQWDGKEVEVDFEEPLRANTTYVITLGTDLADTKGNKLYRSFSLPFSTGERIDSASIKGRIDDPKPEGIMIFAYNLSPATAETLNPSRQKPSFVTQTGKDGTFDLTNLGEGSYRLFAIRDEYKNLLYDIGVDQYGVPQGDLLLSDSLASRNGVQFRMTIEDTMPPFLSSAKSLDDSHILIRLSENIACEGLTAGTVAVEDTGSKQRLRVLDLSFTGEGDKDAQVVTEKQDLGRNFRITLTGWHDMAGNLMLAPGNTGEFSSSMEIDTTLPKADFREIKKRSSDFQVTDSLRISFSEAVRRNSFENGFSLRDSSGVLISGKFLWRHSTRAAFVPGQDLLKGMKYRVECPLDSVVDLSGNSQKDSSAKFSFQTAEERLLSEISGEVRDESGAATGKIILRATNVSRKDIRPESLILEKPGSFRFRNIFDGRYILEGFIDADSDGRYGLGSVAPFQPSERFLIYPDTLKVRARWPLEGVILRFK